MPLRLQITSSNVWPYALHHNPDVIALQFGVGMVPKFKARYNIASSTDILIVKEDREKGRTADR